MKRISSLDLALAFFLAAPWYLNAHATSYYVSSSMGNDTNVGTSWSAPWQTIAKLNRSAMQTGDRVYFLVGDEWDNEFLTVNWSGTSGNHAVVGAYRSNSDGTVAYGSGTANQRPIIDDHYQWHGQTFTEVSGSNPGIVVSGSYVDVENIEVKESGWGILVRGNAQSNVTVNNVLIDGAYQCGIQADGITGLTIQDSELVNAEAFRGIFKQDGNWCSTIGVQHSHDILIRNNYVHESWGEGINAFYGSTNAVVANNVLYANAAVGIYMGALNGADVHGNLILGTADKQFWRTSLSTGPGIAMDNEAYEFVGGPTNSRGESTGNGSLCSLGAYSHYSGSESVLCPNALQNIDIYDNLVAGTSDGLAVWFADYPADYTNVRVFNNTFVDNEQQIYLGGQNASNFVLTNNIFLSATPGMIDVNGSNYGMTFDTNYWSQGRPRMVGSNAISSATDVVGGVELARMTGWRGISAITQVPAAYFAPVAGSSTLGKGTRDGLFFDTDYFGAALRDPIDLGAIAATKAASAPEPIPTPAPKPIIAVNKVTPNPAAAGATVTVTGTFTTTTSATHATLYFWLAMPNGHDVAKTSVYANFSAGVPTPVTTTMSIPAYAPAGTYVVSAGAYAGLTPMRPYIGNYATVEVE